MLNMLMLAHVLDLASPPQTQLVVGEDVVLEVAVQEVVVNSKSMLLNTLQP